MPVADRDARTTAIRKQFADDAITRSRKLESAWWAGDGAYIVSSFSREKDNPGVAKVHDGQI